MGRDGGAAGYQGDSNLTTPQTPIQTTILRPPPERPMLTLEHAAAQIVQNVAGGIGLGVVVAVAFWWANVEFQHSWKWALGTAGIAFGIIMAIRAWADEFKDASIRASWKAAMQDLQNENDELHAQLAAKDSILVEKERDLNYARWIASRGGGKALVNVGDEGRADAVWILQHWYGSGNWLDDNYLSRDKLMKRFEWSKSRAELAHEFVRAVVVYKGTKPVKPEKSLSELIADLPVMLPSVQSGRLD